MKNHHINGVAIALLFPDSRVTDLLHGHGGSISSWLHKLSGSWTSKSGATVHYDLEAGEEGDNKGRMHITRADVERGLKVFATGYPRHFSDWLQENDDDITFDVFIQCCIFGRVVYG